MKKEILALIVWAIAGISTIILWNSMTDGTKLLDYILCWVCLMFYITAIWARSEKE